MRHIGAQVPDDTYRLLEKLRQKLQAESPDRAVSRSDVIRHALHSLSADYSIVWPEFKSEDDESSKNREEKGKTQGGN